MSHSEEEILGALNAIRGSWLTLDYVEEIEMLTSGITELITLRQRVQELEAENANYKSVNESLNREVLGGADYIRFNELQAKVQELEQKLDTAKRMEKAMYEELCKEVELLSNSGIEKRALRQRAEQAEAERDALKAELTEWRAKFLTARQGVAQEVVPDPASIIDFERAENQALRQQLATAQAEAAVMREVLSRIDGKLPPGPARPFASTVILTGAEHWDMHTALSGTAAKAYAERVQAMERALRVAKEHLGGPFREQDFPCATHEGSCGPESGCDGNCMDRAHMFNHNRLVGLIDEALGEE